MPSYDYHCPDNGRILEVKHRMADTLNTWGALCAQANIEPGDTPLHSPIQKKISSMGLTGGGPAPASNSGSCGGGVCGGH